MAVVTMDPSVDPAPATTRNRRRKDEWGSPTTYFIALLVIGVTLGPVAYIVLGGFRDNSQITDHPAGLPHPWVFSNYASVLQSSEFWNDFTNSVIVAVFTTAGIVVLGLMASYVLARYTFRGRGLMFGLFASGLMFPISVAVTPLYLLIKQLGMLFTLPGVILPQIAFGLPTTIIILVPFLKAIPDEIEEASAMDGCSRLGFFLRMVVPLAKPGLLTTGILAFVAAWNSYLLPLFILGAGDTATLPLGVKNFTGEHSVDTAQILAFTSLAMLPALLVFTLFERRIVGGLQGAVKG
ncbi:MAG: carbohydrate ABC transporter permease [Nocardioidaceae bacterium]|nr:carbohydrate ABC transporter permease [Nocardioidaceae bacterium]MCL2613309.1 carbohydrate ABC transporter permease [Nocardioidaceae bacterium]